MPRPETNDYAAFYNTYVSKVAGDDVAAVIRKYADELQAFYCGLPDDKGDYRYAEGKWSVKELLQHVIDAERIFAYRALRIARHDATPLPGFDENAYTPVSGASRRTLQSLKDEFLAVRKATDTLLLSLDDEQLSQRGTASGQPVTANAIAFIIFGHMLHHQQIMKERYL